MIKQPVRAKSDTTPKPATGAQLFALTAALRRKGFTASFGVDKDPKLKERVK